MNTLKLSGFEVIITILLLAFGIKVAFAQDVPWETSKERTVAIISSKDGFYPAVLAARQGEKLKIVLTAVDFPGCLLTKDGRLNLAVAPGKLAAGEIMLEQAGDLEFYCPTGALKGKIMVRPPLPPKTFLNQKQSWAKRKIASEDISAETLAKENWRPREE